MDTTLRFLRIGACALGIAAFTTMLLVDGRLIGLSLVIGLVSSIIAAAITVVRSRTLRAGRGGHSRSQDDSFTEYVRTVEAANKQFHDSGWG